ncbi:MAG: malate dehydrogenase [Rickettsiales bacterium]|nr:malate dehydrogenase [Rickettsiales bacterium]
MKKISLIGAGNIGSILAYSISRKKLGNIVLVDVVKDLAKGKCLDLEQSFAVDNIGIKINGTEDITKIKDSDVIVITAGVARKPGMSRDDLIEVNFSIISQIGNAIKKYSPNAFVICVTNPLDAMTWSLKKVANIKKNKIVGMAGILDSARFKYFLAKKMNISMECIQTMVLGGHGDTMVPLLRYTSISGIQIEEFIKKKKITIQDLEKVIDKTRNGGGEIVSLLKDSSAFFSPASSTIEMVESYLHDQKKLLPCSAYLDGEFMEKDIFVGVPAIIGKNGIEKIFEVNLTSKEQKQFSNSINSVKELIKKCKKLLV